MKINQRLCGIQKKDTQFYNDSSITIQKIRNAERNGILSVNPILSPSISNIAFHKCKCEHYTTMNDIYMSCHFSFITLNKEQNVMFKLTIDY